MRGGPAWRRVMPNALVAAAVAAVLALGTWNVLVTGDRDAARATAMLGWHPRVRLDEGLRRSVTAAATDVGAGLRQEMRPAP